MSAFNRKGSLRLSPRPWPWERRVTVCIAAACQGDDRSHLIVLCSDWRTSTPLGSTETMLKQNFMPHGFMCLVSGTDSEITATLPVIRDRLRDVKEIHEGNIKAAVDDALLSRKREKVEQFVRARYALSYDDFINNGRVRLPEENFRRTIVEIELMKMEARFIVAGFCGGFSTIIETDCDYGCCIKEGVSTIGEGQLLAYASLAQREQAEVLPLGKTLYQVYEAKRVAERIGSVGPTTSLAILYPNKTIKVLPDGETSQLNNYLNIYRPKPVPMALEIELDGCQEYTVP